MNQAKIAQDSWWVYLIRSQNQALYCGISKDPDQRLLQHQSGRGARFFASSPAQAIVYREACLDKSTALKREIAIKKLRKTDKEQLVQQYHQQLSKSQL